MNICTSACACTVYATFVVEFKILFVSLNCGLFTLSLSIHENLFFYSARFFFLSYFQLRFYAFIFRFPFIYSLHSMLTTFIFVALSCRCIYFGSALILQLLVCFFWHIHIWTVVTFFRINRVHINLFKHSSLLYISRTYPFRRGDIHGVYGVLFDKVTLQWLW